MKRSWFGFAVREPAVAEGFGARLDGQVPAPLGVASSYVARQERTQRSWWMPVARIIRNALIAAVAMAAVPLITVSVSGDHLATMLYRSNTNVRTRMMVVAEPARAFGVAHDPSITPMEAGVALNALQYRRVGNGEFAMNRPATHFVRPWRVNLITSDMFQSSRPDVYAGPSSRTILEAAAKGFSPREQAYLKALAEAPIWRTFDLVARAPAVDVVGGQLQVPFATDALPEQRPLPSYKGSRELTYAAVSRAAYYMSIGQPGKAEEVLRSIISFGFVLIDNGTTTMDELIGTVDVGVGRDALRRFYVLQHDPRANEPGLAVLAKDALQRPRANDVAGVSSDDVRRQLLARLADPALPRSERFNAVRDLTLSQCTTVRGMLFGQQDVRDAIERASRTFARYPSERAVVELETRLPSARYLSVGTSPVQTLLSSPAIVAGAVLHNPRMGACTLLLTAGR